MIPYWEIGWRSPHPNILRKRDSNRVIKKKTKRWPPTEERTPMFVWFSCDRSGKTPNERGKSTTVSINKNDSPDIVAIKISSSMEGKEFIEGECVRVDSIKKLMRIDEK